MTDRSHVIAEVYPGAANDIDRLAEAAGGWVCEQHPDKSWPHDDCAGPGMFRADVRATAGPRSSCCGAEVTLAGLYDYTRRYVCRACGESCEVE